MRIVTDASGRPRVIDSAGNEVPNVTRIKLRTSKQCGCVQATVELDNVALDIESRRWQVTGPVFDAPIIEAAFSNDLEPLFPVGDQKR
jgi:hypothetical protein